MNLRKGLSLLVILTILFSGISYGASDLDFMKLLEASGTKKGVGKSTRSQESVLEQDDREQAQQRFQQKEPSLIEKNYILKGDDKGELKLKQYGYDFFEKKYKTEEQYENVPVGPDYVLGPGDSINIFLWGKMQEKFTVNVETDGGIFLPKAGKVSISGLTFKEAQKVITSSLKQHFANFEISMTIGEIRSITVYVMGEVNNPGGYQVSSLSNLFSVLYKSGGPSKKGTLRNIKLLRGNKLYTTIDLYNYLLYGKHSNQVILKDGDTIFVPIIGNTVAVKGSVKRPGIYEYVGYESISNALEKAGGINSIGYKKKIQINRVDGEQREIIDVNGKSTLDKQVIDGDIIEVSEIVSRRKNQVVINGNVKRPGVYSLSDGMRLVDLIELAGGLVPDTYMDRVLIDRSGPDYDYLYAKKEKQIVKKNVYDEEKQLYYNQYVVVDKGDEIDNDFYLKQLLDEKNKEDSLDDSKGTELREADRKSQDRSFDILSTIKAAKDTDEINNEELTRFEKDYVDKNDYKIHRIYSYDLKKALNKENDNILLEDGDIVRIFSIKETEPEKYVYISGQIKNPGRYAYNEKMNVSELVFAAGGVKRGSIYSEVELHRVNKSGDINLINVDLQKALNVKENNKDDVLLLPEDHIFIKEDFDANNRKYVYISGQVKYPGKYLIEKNEKISSLLRRVGGFQDNAFLKGAIFIRKSLRISEKNMNEKIQLDEEKRVLHIQANMAAENTGEFALNNELLKLVEKDQSVGRLIVKIDEPDSMNKSDNDIVLEDQDQIYIPQTPSSIQVLGGVYNPSSVIVRKGKTVNYYVNKVGGATRYAVKSDMYIVKANGEVVRDWQYSPSIGDIVVLPEEIKREFNLFEVILNASEKIATVLIAYVGIVNLSK